MDIDITVTGRNVHIPEHFRTRISEKLPRAIKYDDSITGVTVILTHYNNPRRAGEDSKVEITAGGAGHVSRAEAYSDSFLNALDDAIEKLEGQLRKVKTRRDTAKQGHRSPLSTGESARRMIDIIADEADDGTDIDTQPHDPYEEFVDYYQPGTVVRHKSIAPEVLSVDDALSNMERVGHDFYLFVNRETGSPAVVYRRHAYNYGIINMDK